MSTYPYYTEIICIKETPDHDGRVWKSGEVYRRFGPNSEHNALKTMQGVMHNLNFDRFIVRVVDAAGEMVA